MVSSNGSNLPEIGQVVSVRQKKFIVTDIQENSGRRDAGVIIEHEDAPSPLDNEEAVAAIAGRLNIDRLIEGGQVRKCLYDFDLRT